MDIVDKYRKRGYNKEAMERIYLDHAATTPLDKEILEKMIPYFTDCFGNANSHHATGRKAMAAVDNARDTLATLLNAKPSEIYFTSGGTEADNWAMLGGAYAQREKGKTHILVSSIEHHAVLGAAERLAKEGFCVEYLPVNSFGAVEPNDLKKALREDTGLVAVMLANNETGAIQDVKTLAEIAHANGSIFFTDAVQAAPYMRLDVKDLGVDMLSISGHKFYGPKGVGALYIKSGVKVYPHALGGEQERGLRGGTINVPAVVGLAAAYAKKEATMDETNAKLEALRGIFLGKILSLEGVEKKVNGIGGKLLPSIINIGFHNLSNVDILYKLDLKGVSASAGSACASSSIQPSHVLLAMGLDEKAANSSVRFSIGKENDEEQIYQAAEVLTGILKELSGA